MKTLSLLPELQRGTHVWRVTLSIGKRQAGREALMIEAMICQAFSRMYCPPGLVKARGTDAYQVQRNQSWSKGSQLDGINLNFFFFFTVG